MTADCYTGWVTPDGYMGWVTPDVYKGWVTPGLQQKGIYYNVWLSETGWCVSYEFRDWIEKM